MIVLRKSYISAKAITSSATSSGFVTACVFHSFSSELKNKQEDHLQNRNKNLRI